MSPGDRRGRSGCLGALVLAVVLIVIVVVIAAVVIGVLLITNAGAVLAWVNGVLKQIQQLPFIGGGGGG